MKAATLLFVQPPHSKSLRPSVAPCREYASAPHQLSSWSLSSLAAALLLAVIPAVQAQPAGPDFTATQNVTVSGQYIPGLPNGAPCCPVPIAISQPDYLRTNLGESEYDFSSVPGITTGKATWSNTLDDLGFIRSNSDLSISHEFGNFDSFDNLKVEVSNTVSYYDAISQATLGGRRAYARFQTKLTGNLDNIVFYAPLSESGAVKANYQSSVAFSSQLANSRGGADEVVELAYTDSYTSGFFGSNVNEESPIDVDIFFNQQSTLGAVFFSFDYTDNFLVDIEGIDTGRIDIFMQNNLGSTVVTTASWYDEDGALLPFAVTSEGGYVYAPNPVPLPAAAWLFISALSGLVIAKRKQLKA